MYLAIDRGVSKSEILSTNSNSTGHLKQKRNNTSNHSSHLTLTIFILHYQLCMISIAFLKETIIAMDI